MRGLIASALAAIAIVATVAILPASNWVFRNQVDLVLSNGSTTTGETWDQGFLETLTPRWLTDPNTYVGNTREEELARTALTTYPKRVDLLHEFVARYPNDALGRALVARLVCMRSGHIPDEPPIVDPLIRQSHDKEFEFGREACLAGERIEPENAFFPYMQAVFEMHLGHRHAISTALADAATKHHYNSHLGDWSQEMIKAETQAKGYRGELVSMGLEASLVFPDLTHVKSLGKYLNRAGTLQEKRDLVQIQERVVKEGQTLIEVLVALSNLRSAVRDPIPLSSATSHQLTDEKYLELVNAFDAKLSATGVASTQPSASKIYQNLQRFCDFSKKYVDNLPASLPGLGGDDGGLARLVVRTFSPYVALASLLIGFIAGATACGFCLVKSDGIRRMVPHFLGLPCWLVSSVLPRGPESNIRGFGELLAVIQLCVALLHLGGESGASRSRIATLLGGAVAIVSLAATDHSGILGGIAYFVVLGVLWKSSSGEPLKFSRWAIPVLFVALLLLAGAAVTVSSLEGRLLLGLFGGGLLGLCASALFVDRGSAYTRSTVSVSLLLFSVSYLLSTGIEVRGNHGDSLVNPRLSNEANTIRKMAGID
jgi:hypothetical protein